MITKQPERLLASIYLYLLSLIGLILLTIGTIGLVDMGLKVFVFTQAEQESQLERQAPPMPPVPVRQLEELSQNPNKLSPQEQTLIQQWLADYQAWQSKQQKFDYLTARRQREAARNLAFIITGLPLYLYHWKLIKQRLAA